MKAMVLKRMALKAKDRKGFTLVEVIVVLVIIAILMAIAVPSLTGYIDKARRDSAIAEAASAKTAVQTIISDAYAHGGTYTYGTATVIFAPDSNTFDWEGTATGTGTLLAAAEALTGADYVSITIEEVINNQVTELIVDLSNGYTATFEDSAWSVIPTPDPA